MEIEKSREMKCKRTKLCGVWTKKRDVSAHSSLQLLQLGEILWNFNFWCPRMYGCRRLHVHATLHPTEAECDLPYIASLVPFPDRLVQFLDDLARRVVSPQFHEAAPASGGDDGGAAGDGHDDESGVGVEDVDTFASDGHQTPKGNEDDRSKPDDSGESSRDPSSETGGSDSDDEVDASGW
ncbi:Hypothetical predicted protein [Olea europaea subsp. europaea]|uniref:Uncharacterized protein n=1 Tax=Olea europaea subsp. europaea TaxID=158383 RepID=A0A8S0PBU6_OLEEU|nr:Hypothetical predicted protein [Olea europaea subsp. europaea]